jgi:hypothetical protein
MKKFFETKVGQFLQRNAPKVLDIVGDVFPAVGVVTELFKSEVKDPALQAELEILLKEYEANELKAYLGDVANAREMNIQIQQSSAASWLSRNIAYLIDIVIISATILLALLLYFQPIPAVNKEIAYSLLGILFSLSVQILSFHRGSSKGSQDKSDAIFKQLNNSK